MKKLVLMFVAIAAMSFASCGDNKAAQEPVEEEEAVEVNDSVNNDSISNDSTAQDEAAAAPEEAAEN
ncbi:MAG: entericidin [Prevotella sp.]|nr:entericidin [Prevotella sp.]